MINVIQDPNNEVPTEVVEQAIVDIAEAMRRLTASRLKENTIILLVSDASGVNRKEVRAVIEALNQLENRFLKPKKSA